jgi:hypothetical protein
MMMKCKEALDAAYDSFGGELPPFGVRFSMALHVLFCGRCAQEMQLLEAARFCLQTSFFPDAPDFEDSILERIRAEAEEEIHFSSLPGGVPVRGWVIVGFIVLLSLFTAFFDSLSRAQDSYFLLSLGILMGIVTSVYGAIFIGSHLKEFSAHFRLH